MSKIFAHFVVIFFITTIGSLVLGFASATAQTALSFSPTSLAFSVVKNGSTPNKTSTLSANTGTPAVSLTKSANSNWLILPSAAHGSLSFGINTTGLAVGTYSSTVTASSGSYTNGTLQVTLTITSQWLSKASALRKRSEVTSVVYNGKLYAFLGFRDSSLNVEPSAEVYVPGAKPAEFIPNDNDPSAAEGRTSQLLLADLFSVMVGVPVFAESVEVLFPVVPFSTTENERLVGENDNAGAVVTVRVTCRVALA